jgi:hypothetical protein
MKMGKIKTFISENKGLVFGGLTMVTVVVGAMIVNNSEFMKGCRELILANEEGRLEKDF